MRKQTVRSRKLVRSYLEALILTITLGVVLRLFVLSPYKIPTNTMNPTLLSGDFVFVYKIPFGITIPFYKKIGKVNNLKRGDVVLFYYSKDPETKFIKRVVAMPGDKVEYKNNKLIINDQEISTDFVVEENFDFVKNYQNLIFKSESLSTDKEYVVIHNKNQKPQNLDPVLVPPGEVFLMGDHRDNSDDSRYWGSVPIENLEGSVELIWFSINAEASQIRWNRLFQKVL